MVTYPSDKDATVLIGKETTWGTAITTDRTVGLIQRCAFTASNNLRRIGSINSRAIQDIAEGKFGVTGELEYLLQHGRIMEYAFGTVSHTNSSSDWKHTFDFTDTLPSFTIEKSYNLDTDICQKVAGATLNSFRIGLALDGEVSCTAGFTGKTIADSNTASACSIDTIATYKDYMGSVTVTTGVTGVQSWEVNLTNNTDLVYGLGSRLPVAPFHKMRNIDFRFTAVFDSIVEFEQFMGGTSPNATTAITTQTITFVADNGTAYGSGQRKLSIALANAVINEIAQPVVFDNFVTADISGYSKGITTANCYIVDTITSTAW